MGWTDLSLLRMLSMTLLDLNRKYGQWEGESLLVLLSYSLSGLIIYYKAIIQLNNNGSGHEHSGAGEVIL